MRVLGTIMMVLGLLFCLTVIGAVIGIPMMLIGLVLAVAGGSNRTVVVHVNQQNTPQYQPHAQPHYPPHPAVPPLADASGYSSDPQPPPLPLVAQDGKAGTS
jgi:hypothetical protein